MQIQTIGDVHLGRVFKTGVPLDRRGDREGEVWDTFKDQVRAPGSDLKVIMGDLFDEFVVPPEVVIGAAMCLHEATAPVIILRGNHDASRNSEKMSSFDLLMALVGQNPNIQFAAGEAPLVQGGRAFFGWHPFVSAAEMAEKLPDDGSVTEVYGHWDTTLHTENDHNLIPLEGFARKGVQRVFTGHIHKAERYRSHGLEVIVTGSMLPYAHGEQGPDDRTYLTLTPDEIEAELAQDPDAFHWSNVRVLLPAGANYQKRFNCLSLTFKAQLGTDAEAEEDPDVDVQFDAFNFDHLAQHCFDKNNVPQDYRAELLARLQEKNFHD